MERGKVRQREEELGRGERAEEKGGKVDWREKVAREEILEVKRKGVWISEEREMKREM
jgi:hypothetical protein